MDKETSSKQDSAPKQLSSGNSDFKLALYGLQSIKIIYDLIYISNDIINYQKHRKNELVNIYEVLRICRCLSSI